MAVEIKVVEGKSGLKEFIHLPYEINRGRENWLPNLIRDEYIYFDPEKNRSFQHCDTIMAIAYVDGDPRGRIMGIIHRDYNQKHNEKAARFGYLDSYNDFEVVKELVVFIENWAKERGMNYINGPYGFSDKDPQGFLYQGFNDRPLLDTSTNAPYMIDLIERCGYAKLVDCYTYRFDVNLFLPDLYERVKQRVLGNGTFRVIEPSSKKEIPALLVPVMHLVNETYKDLYGFHEMDEEEINELKSRYEQAIDPALVKLINKDDELVAFVVGMRNISDGFKKARGRLLPFGWFHIMKDLRTSDQLDLMLGAVKPDFRGMGLEVVMGLYLLETARKINIKTVETHLILESNMKMRSVIERLGAPIAKIFRVYTKDLL